MRSEAVFLVILLSLLIIIIISIAINEKYHPSDPVGSIELSDYTCSEIEHSLISGKELPTDNNNNYYSLTPTFVYSIEETFIHYQVRCQT